MTGIPMIDSSLAEFPWTLIPPPEGYPEPIRYLPGDGDVWSEYCFRVDLHPDKEAIPFWANKSNRLQTGSKTRDPLVSFIRRLRT